MTIEQSAHSLNFSSDSPSHSPKIFSSKKNVASSSPIMLLQKELANAFSSFSSSLKNAYINSQKHVNNFVISKKEEEEKGEEGDTEDVKKALDQYLAFIKDISFFAEEFSTYIKNDEHSIYTSAQQATNQYEIKNTKEEEKHVKNVTNSKDAPLELKRALKQKETCEDEYNRAVRNRASLLEAFGTSVNATLLKKYENRIAEAKNKLEQIDAQIASLSSSFPSSSSPSFSPGGQTNAKKNTLLMPTHNEKMRQQTLEGYLSLMTQGTFDYFRKSCNSLAIFSNEISFFLGKVFLSKKKINWLFGASENLMNNQNSPQQREVKDWSEAKGMLSDRKSKEMQNKIENIKLEDATRHPRVENEKSGEFRGGLQQKKPLGSPPIFL